MHPLTLECFHKPSGNAKAVRIEHIRFQISDDHHRRMEEAEEILLQNDQKEIFLDVEPSELNMELPDNLIGIENCRLRVYISQPDQRGHFHLVGELPGNGGTVYTGGLMIDYIAA